MLLVIMDSRLVKQLVSSRKALRKKYKSLKTDIAKSQSSLEKSYKPITQPLQELITSLKQPKSEIKEESLPDLKRTSLPLYKAFQEYLHTVPTDITAGPEGSFQFEPSLAPEESYFEDELGRPPTRKELEEKQMQKWLLTYTAPLPRTYLDDQIRDHNKFDHTFGVYFDGDENTYKIGNTPVSWEDRDFVIGNRKYPGTIGLYELMFKKQPISTYKSADLDNYLDIIMRNNVHYLDYDPEKGINTSNAHKFKNIIKPRISTINFITKEKEFEKQRKREELEKSISPIKNKKLPRTLRPRTGSIPTLSSTKIGKNLNMMMLNKQKIEYRYFDDPNELVDRLRLLIASQQAGNTNHHNEVVSIIEELREAKIIA